MGVGAGRAAGFLRSAGPPASAGGGGGGYGGGREGRRAPRPHTPLPTPPPTPPPYPHPGKRFLERLLSARRVLVLPRPTARGEVGVAVSPHFREVERLAQSHTANECQKQDLNPRPVGSKVLPLSIKFYPVASKEPSPPAAAQGSFPQQNSQ